MLVSAVATRPAARVPVCAQSSSQRGMTKQTRIALPWPRHADLQQPVLAGLAAAALLLSTPAAALADAGASSSGSTLELSFVDSSIKTKLEERDAAASYKCSGGMFDCDGDRREFAKKQWSDLLERGGPVRKSALAAEDAQAAAEAPQK